MRYIKILHRGFKTNADVKHTYTNICRKLLNHLFQPHPFPCMCPCYGTIIEECYKLYSLHFFKGTSQLVFEDRKMKTGQFVSLCMLFRNDKKKFACAFYLLNSENQNENFKWHNRDLNYLTSVAFLK